MNYCPCCSHVLLRHIHGHEVYWFCRNCWQSMPISNYGVSKITSCQLSQAIHSKPKIYELNSAA